MYLSALAVTFPSINFIKLHLLNQSSSPSPSINPHLLNQSSSPSPSINLFLSFPLPPSILVSSISLHHPSINPHLPPSIHSPPFFPHWFVVLSPSRQLFDYYLEKVNGDGMEDKTRQTIASLAQSLNTKYLASLHGVYRGESGC